MPLYDIEHTTPLSPHTQSLLAQQLTQLHRRRFNTPTMFINVRFRDVAAQPLYRNGRLAVYNRAILRTRAGERTREEYVGLCREVVRAWHEIVVGGDDEEKNGLRCVWVMACLTVGMELGIVRPKVGEERMWLVENRSEFERLAAEGDEDMIELVKTL